MLEHDEVVDLLTMVAASDGRREFTPDDVTLWQAVLARGGVTNAADAKAAIVEHLATSTEWLMPKHIIDGVRSIRAERHRRGPSEAELTADVDPNDFREWQRVLVERRRLVGDGALIVAEVGSGRGQLGTVRVIEGRSR